MSPALAPSLPPLVDTFIRLALLSAIEDGEHTPEGAVHWASEVLPPAVRAQIGPAELLRRAAALLSVADDNPTEELQREPTH